MPLLWDGILTEPRCERKGGVAQEHRHGAAGFASPRENRRRRDEFQPLLRRIFHVLLRAAHPRLTLLLTANTQQAIVSNDIQLHLEAPTSLAYMESFSR